MSFINLMASDAWSEADIMAHGRAIIDSQVCQARQNELRTIMLGHIAGMRTATADELAEIALVAQITEQQALDNAQARADMALLSEVLAKEALPSTVLSVEGEALYLLRNPVMEAVDETTSP